MPVKMERREFILFFVLASMIIGVKSVPAEDSWRYKKGEHFIVQYGAGIDDAWAAGALRSAERYYDIMGRQVGFTRIDDFWTWEDRAKIVVYPDQEKFMAETGQPVWSKGGAARHAGGERTIVTFDQGAGFLNGVLPHEIGHLVLRDLVAESVRLPLWFEEGFAQLQEAGKRRKANEIMKRVVAAGEYIPFEELMRMDVRGLKDTAKVAIFYAQSISVVDFLISAYGSRSFGRFCRNLSNGMPFWEALHDAYGAYANSLDALESKWLAFMRTGR